MDNISLFARKGETSVFYRVQHSMNSDIAQWKDGFDFSFPAHLHSNFEPVTLTEGSMDITVDGQCFTLAPDPFYPDRFTAMAGQLDDVCLKGLLYSVCGGVHRAATYTERRLDQQDQSVTVEEHT